MSGTGNPVAPVAYQGIEPGIGQFREFEPPPSAYSYKFVGTFSCAYKGLRRRPGRPPVAAQDSKY